MTTMWSVSRGEYETREVLCLCASEADANSIIERMVSEKAGYDLYVESFPVVSSDYEPPTVLHMEATIVPPGVALHLTERSVRWWSFQDEPECETSASGFMSLSGSEIAVYARGTDHDRVRRSFAEELARIGGDKHVQRQILAKGGHASR